MLQTISFKLAELQFSQTNILFELYSNFSKVIKIGFIVVNKLTIKQEKLFLFNILHHSHLRILFVILALLFYNFTIFTNRLLVIWLLSMSNQLLSLHPLFHFLSMISLPRRFFDIFDSDLATHSDDLPLGQLDIVETPE